LVSHSKKITDGLKEMITEMTGEDARIFSAGGTDDGRLGTSAPIIMEKIEACQNCNRILIFCDVGSSILSAEAALDLMDEDLKEKCLIVDAPLVEGAFVAGVQSLATDNLEDILNELSQLKVISKFS
ncbi:PTS-dependent dihydroxyacetone kinase phosphotransferase subunit DhaM, partial [Bacillaceae bacterium Marseille-Q3522]|nr:PTS-dependent dihydroxyacetone kinase phosphotransferase subunit DhaM [Bacillaceae bacterium Marseille-Q3522]